MKTKLAILFFLSLINIGFSQEKPKIGLVLSGGGAKGLAHIGVIRVLESKGIKPDYIAGTSMGALVGGLYAIGYTPDEMEEIVTSQDWEYLLSDQVNRKNYLIGQGNKNKNTIFSLPLDGLKPAMKSGLYSGQNILTLLEILTKDYSKKIDFDSLPIPFRCVGTNIATGATKVFKNGRLSDVMRASMSIPSVFNPYEIDGELYVDGGLVNNFPTNIVKKMGADIIIGVDVGAVLYKKEEINSIIKILDQTSSFYNYRVARKNKRLCDIYLRPDINGISAMSFSEIDSIIMRGTNIANENSAIIDSVFNKYNYIPIKYDSLPYNNNITIDTIIINPTIKKVSNMRGARKLVNGKLDIKHTPYALSNKELSSRVNRLYGSKFFEEVSMSFLDNDTSYSLVLNVKEKRLNEFQIGVRYDDVYGINVLLSAYFRNLLIYGSLLELSGVAGQSPQFRARYTTDRGASIGFGTSLVYNNFDVYTYEDSKKYASYNYNRALLDVFIHSYIGNYNRLLLGAEYSGFLLSSTQSVSDIEDMKETFFNFYSVYVFDTWDRAYYPNKGFKFKARGDIIFQEDNSVLNTLWGRGDLVIPISKKLKILANGFVGFGSFGVDTTLFRYETGGMAKNRIQWYNSFPGLKYLEHGTSNIWIASISPRYEFYKNNFITATFALTAMDNNFENLFINASRMYAGMSLKYGFSSMFGPMEISTDYSFNNYDKSVFISLGFWF